MSRFREMDRACKVYVGNLWSTTTKHELECAFRKFGPLKDVWIARNPPGFAFIEFVDPRDAEDSIRALDGTRLCGTRIRVEMSTSRPREGIRRSWRSRSRTPRRRSYSRSRSRSRSPRYSRSRSISRDRR